MNEDKIKFKRTLRTLGNSTFISIPKELLLFLGVDYGDEITFIGDNGKYGKYLAIYVEDKDYVKED